MKKNKKGERDKRGVSPVIATILLIAIVVVLGFIIFLWARSVINEDVQKFGEPVQRSCDSILISASSLGNSLVITNNDDRIPLYNVQLHISESNGDTSVEEYTTPLNLAPGRSSTINVNGANVIRISPILLGSKGSSDQIFICDNTINVD